ncbi:hypothetical protein RJ639_024248 [Escallonia herrerae]|uniref:Uncharacterized protein n=1 Tax=Escallonia herrerae TaxID=1293975 RepID=A0AA89AES4_9ASTE|nr:hypothetical protein RJ639_024248 [Escallonia herrerae]
MWWALASEMEARPEDPVNVLCTDELFSDRKLMLLHLSTIRLVERTIASSQINPLNTPKSHRRTIISGSSPYLFSPKAPWCSSKWKELLGLKKLYHSSNVKQDSKHKTMLSSAPSHALSTANL